MVEEYVNKMAKAIEATEREFSKIRAGLATPAILEQCARRLLRHLDSDSADCEGYGP